MSILGAHMSIAGGYYKALERASNAGCDCVQIFTKSNKMWKAKPLTDEDCRLFSEHLTKLKISCPISHSSYLINLASPDNALWKRSLDAFVIELRRADRLGIPWVVVHPGSYVSSTERQGMRHIIRALNEASKRTSELSTGVLLETTAGQGTNLGWQFEQLAEMLGGVKHPQRFGVCFDTCHVFAAGYPLGTEREYKATMREFNKLIGVKYIKAFHLNDSQCELGSRRDRHDHIGRGKIGKEAFRLLLNDRRFKKIPMYLETPKEDDRGRNLDKINLRTLRRLIDK